MGSCVHGTLGLCLKAGVECYQSGSKRKDPDMSLEDYKSIIDQCKNKVQQIALGGAGDPNLHKNFKEIMQYTRENGIVPNYTTSGINLTDEQAEVTKQFAGAVAVSWYDRSQDGYTVRAIKKFLGNNIITNIHYVLSNKSIDEAIERIKNQTFPDVNAIIFLLHKPVGIGRQENVLKTEDPRVKKFFKLVDEGDHPWQIGFDSCSIPGIVNFTKEISLNSIDTCEGARFSAYITPDMKMTPCSFDQDLRWAVDLRRHTIQEAWDSDAFESFRNNLRDSCPSCLEREHCMGGCPIKREIVLCNRPEKGLGICTP